jgi:hypothetical protein
LDTKFLIVSNVRCGATWLQEILGRVPGVECALELRWLSDSPKFAYRENIKNGDSSLYRYFEKSRIDADVVGAKLLLDPQAYEEDDFAEIYKSVEEDVRIIHIQRPYKEILRSIIQNQGYSITLSEGASCFSRGIRDAQMQQTQGEVVMPAGKCGEVVKALYANDRFFHRFQERDECYIQVEYEEISERLYDLVSFLGLHVSNVAVTTIKMNSDFRKLPEKRIPNVLKYSKVQSVLKLYESLRILLKNTSYLSETVCQKIFQSELLERSALVYNQAVDKSCYPITVFVDLTPGSDFLEEFFFQRTIGKDPRTLLIIFSAVEVVREILFDSRYVHLLKEGSLKIWHIMDWEEQLGKELVNIRSPFQHCESIISIEGHPVAKRIQKLLSRACSSYILRVEKSRGFFNRYYLSREFKERLNQIKKGASPRIYIERACSSIAIKRFSNHCAKSFREIGCEVFIHDPCKGGCIDYTYAMELEMEAFLPDLVVRSPNIIEGYENIGLNSTEVPILYSMQDTQPHLDCTQFLRHFPLRKKDLLFFILPRFKEVYLSAGALSSQLICDYIPTEMSSFDLDEYAAEARIDVGYVKTMPERLCLKEIFDCRTEEDKLLAEQLEKKIALMVRQKGAIDLLEVMSWGKTRKQKESLHSYYHSCMSLMYMEHLQTEGFELGLTGRNWEQFPALKKFTLGHVESRESYQLRFLNNKINLSINPFAQHHPRILEGGICGAFFLVYRVPEKISWCNISKDLKPGKHFDFFASPEELVDKCKYYLSRPDLREKIGNNLRAVVQERFSYKRLCSEFLARFRSSIDLGELCE